MRQILNAQRKARRNLKRRTRRFAAVTAGQARHLEKADLTASRTLAEMGRLAFFNVKIGDKLKALEMLAKHFRLRGEPVAVNGVDWEKLAARLARARTEK